MVFWNVSALFIKYLRHTSHPKSSCLAVDFEFFFSFVLMVHDSHVCDSGPATLQQLRQLVPRRNHEHLEQGVLLQVAAWAAKTFGGKGTMPDTASKASMATTGCTLGRFKPSSQRRTGEVQTVVPTNNRRGSNHRPYERRGERFKLSRWRAMWSVYYTH